MLSVSVFPQAEVKDQRQDLTIPPEKEEVGKGEGATYGRSRTEGSPSEGGWGGRSTSC